MTRRSTSIAVDLLYLNNWCEDVFNSILISFYLHANSSLIFHLSSCPGAARYVDVLNKDSSLSSAPSVSSPSSMLPPMQSHPTAPVNFYIPEAGNAFLLCLLFQFFLFVTVYID